MGHYQACNAPLKLHAAFIVAGENREEMDQDSRQEDFLFILCDL